MIRVAGPKDARTLAELAHMLWPEHSLWELEHEFVDHLQNRDAFLALAEEGEKALGFAHCQMRADYVEGTDSSPVGYLEGIYVKDPSRRRGLGAALLAFCEDWAREKGASQFASDCEVNNAESLAFHLGTGFLEANRLICFVKDLE